MPQVSMWEQNGVVIKFSGEVTASGFVKIAQEIAGEPEFDALRFVIVDFTDVCDHDIDAAALEEVAIIRIGARASNPNVRMVLVTTDARAAALALAMNADPNVGQHEAKVFSTVAQARDWLQQQPPLSAFTRLPTLE
jgi:hypothetical protein